MTLDYFCDKGALNDHPQGVLPSMLHARLDQRRANAPPFERRRHPGMREGDLFGGDLVDEERCLCGDLGLEPMFQRVVDDLGRHSILMVALSRNSGERKGEADWARGSEAYAAC